MTSVIPLLLWWLVSALPVLPGSESASTDTLSIAGLRAPVEIVKDRWGISHIYAQNEADLFFAQGWNAARDRLFQLELWRRRATGTAAEVLGPRALTRDVGARLFRFRGDMVEELSHYHPRGRAIVEAFVRGINAYVERTRHDPSLLPIEFELLEMEPGLWTPEVVVSRHNGLLYNLDGELDYGRAVARIGADAVKASAGFGPGDPVLSLDSTIPSELLFEEVVAPYVAYTSPIDFRPEDVTAEHRAQGEGREGAASRRDGPGRGLAVAAGKSGDRSPGEGSNNWVVAGRLTESGRPMMANDPHRSLGVPSVRYWVHLSAPGWNVIGVGEPTIPGVSIGHNEHGAWGLTVFPTDAEDLYVYETDPSHPDRYRYEGAWQSMRVEVDTIAVEDRAPAIVRLRYTRHGPVTYQDTALGRAFAVRAAWLEPGGAPYLASLRMDQATDWASFREACAYFHIPGENMVWAGRDGTIGWQAVGIAPVRRNWSGLVPVPGDGRYEWDGFLPILDKPHRVDPEEGFIVTANNDLVPPDYPHMDAIGFVWSPPFRWARASELLASGRRHSLADMAAYQMDWLSVPARRIVPLLGPLAAGEKRAERARRLLLEWDHVLAPSSAAAAIYGRWLTELRRRVAVLRVPQGMGRWFTPEFAEVVEWLVTPPPDFGTWADGDPVAGRDTLLIDSLREAVAGLAADQGPDPEAWRYGGPGLKHALLRHPLSDAVEPELRARLDLGPVPRGGDGVTVNLTGWASNQTVGASFRILVDTADWDRTLGTLATGQVGDPSSPHYADLFPLWAENRYFPVYFSRSRVEAAADERIMLTPSP